MTRKDFEFIANTIRNMPRFSPSLRTSRASCAETFADQLAGAFPRFDRERFLRAAIGYDPAKGFDPEVFDKDGNPK